MFVFTDVIAFIELLLLVLGANKTVFLPVVEVIFFTVFGAIVSLAAVGCIVEFFFGGIC